MAEPNLFSEVANSASDIVKNLPEDVKNDLVRGPAQEIGSGISNLVYVVFSPLLMSRVRIEHKVKKMKEELTKSINSIPSEKLVEPSLNIVGPALEGSKYYIENDSIRGYLLGLLLLQPISTREMRFIRLMLKLLSNFPPLTLNV